ncbi:MAG: transcriptional repressor [Peptococcaceae bacterium]|nr:transcriptional repressor [Peptococcaceae bacterium]
MENSQNLWPQGVKKTKQRASVLAILENAEKPLTALDICARREKDGDTAVWPSTVYRVLELFIHKGLVLKTNVRNNDMAVYELNRLQHKHYAVCMNCHKLIALENCPMDTFIPQLPDGEFQVQGHYLEIFGICQDCRPTENNPQ